MSNLEIVVDTAQEYLTAERGLLKLETPIKMAACIFCRETAESYFYATEQVEGKWLFIAQDF